MRSINEVREEMGELDPVPWREVNAEFEASTKQLNKVSKTASKHKKRISRIEWVLIGFLIVMCGFVFLKILEVLSGWIL